MKKSKKLLKQDSSTLASQSGLAKEKSSVSKALNAFIRLLSSVPPALCILYCIFVAFTLATLVFIDKDFTNYYFPNRLTTPNTILICFSLLLFMLAVGAFYLSQRKVGKAKSGLSDKQFYAVITLIFVAVYGVQLFISSHIYLRTTWDVGIVTDAAEKIAFYGEKGVPFEYYSIYPNNILLTYTLAALLCIGKVIIPAHPYAVVLAFTSFVVCGSVFLATLCIYRMTNKRKLTVFGMIIGILMIAINPWIVIPYTDALAMIFPTAAIFFYLFIKNKYLRYVLVAFTCVLGYYYKPTVIIIMIALVIIKLFDALVKLCKKEASLKRGICILLCVVLGAGCAVGVNKLVCFQNETVLDENMQMTATHYFMMGLNIKTEGKYNGEDVKYSQSMPDVETRQQANIEVAKSRIKDLGPKGYARLLVVKNISNYNDGTFGWSGEGNFFKNVPEDNRETTRVLRSFFYTNGMGTNHLKFATPEQVLWLFLLICICCCALPFKTKRGVDNLIALTLLGVSMFLLLFECRARYLFLFTPLFLMLAMTGLNKVYLLFAKRKGTANKSLL